MAANAQIIDLRRVLAERFPKAHSRRPAAPREGLPAGLERIDAVLEGGWPRGRISELVTGGRGTGAVQVLHRMLERTVADGGFLALVDGSDGFDVDAADPACLDRLLWVRCTDPAQAIKAADLLLRDRNLPHVVLDLAGCAVAQLRRIPATTWHRFGRLVEHHGATLVVMAPEALVSSPAYRVRLRSRITLESVQDGPVATALKIRCELERSPAAASGAEGEAGTGDVEVARFG
jgi:hypothetical protein